VYAIVASKEDLPESYQNYLKTERRDRRPRPQAVLDEMKGLWNFKQLLGGNPIVHDRQKTGRNQTTPNWSAATTSSFTCETSSSAAKNPANASFRSERSAWSNHQHAERKIPAILIDTSDITFKKRVLSSASAA